MITRKTKREIEYELSIDDFYNKPQETVFTVNVLSTEGEESFTVKVRNQGVPFSEDDIIDDIISDMDLSEIESWVDQVTIAELSRLSAEVCVLKTDKTGNYHYFSIYFIDCIRISVIDQEQGTSLTGQGYEEIIFLLNNLKNGK